MIRLLAAILLAFTLTPVAYADDVVTEDGGSSYCCEDAESEGQRDGVELKT